MSDAVRSSSLAGRFPLSVFAGLWSRDREGTAGGLTQGPRGRLFRKYVLLFIGLVSLVLLVNSALDFWFTYDENKAALFRIQQEKAGSAARRIEQFVDEIDHQLGWTTAPQWAASPLDQRKFDYVRLLRQVPAITELIQLDETGKEQLKTSRLAIDVVGSGKDYSGSPSFTEARRHRIWFSPVYFRKESEPYMTLAIARAGRSAGVTIAEVNLKLIWDVITGLKIGQSGYAYVVDRDGRLIAHPDISLVLRNTDLSKLPQVMAARAEAPGGQSVAPAVEVAKSIDGKSVLSAHAAIAPLGWTIFVEVPLNEALAPLYGSALRTAALLALALGLAILAALFLARRMTVPIRQLEEGAARIGAGELDRRIDIHTGDELEGLAGQFNQMAGDLQKSYADLEKKVEDRTAELSEALDQQTATAEVLQVINSSPGDLTPVFDAILEKALRLCQADYGELNIYDGEAFHTAAVRNLPPAFAAHLRSAPRTFGPGTGPARMLAGEHILFHLDLQDEEPYRRGDPNRRALVDLGGARSALQVALRKDQTFLGFITLFRQEVRPFTAKQVALLQNFAAQAVIAMENARLLTETQRGNLALRENEERYALVTQAVAEGIYEWNIQSNSLWVSPRLIEIFGLTGLSLTAADWNSLVHPDDFPLYRAALRACFKGLTQQLDCEYRVRHSDGGYRWIEDRGVPVRNAAGWAVRMVGALTDVSSRKKADEGLREALEQQTATAEVLGVINSSPGDLAPVFDAILEKAHTLCGAAHGSLQLYDGENLHAVATHAVSEKFADILRLGYRAAESPASRALIEGKPFAHIADCAEIDHPVFHSAAELAGIRTVLFVALRRDDAFLGLISAARLEVRPFTDKQIALLQNFAAQAVIAMENARLITETREALEQQTATAEVLGVINSSPGDLAPVFDAMLEKATRLCEAPFGILRTWDGERFHFGAVHGDPQFCDWVRQRGPIRTDHDASLLGRIQSGERVVHIIDAQNDEAYRTSAGFREMAEASGIRSAITVALHKDDALLGIITVYRQEVRPFSDKQIALLQNFATQAVIAMENARLITETREALEQQTATAEVLQVINSSPGDLAPVFDTMLERVLRLCEAKCGNITTYDGESFHFAAVAGHPEFDKWARENGPGRPGPGTTMERMLRGEQIIQVTDIAGDEVYRAGSPVRRALVEIGGFRTFVGVALRKDDVLLGIIHLYRQEARPFTDKQIALLRNFAAQAVIAMENARLITETREALEQQTATAEVLGVINSSPGDLAPVFDAMLEKATHLCEASFGVLCTYDGASFRATALRGVPAAYAKFLTAGPLQPGPGNGLARVAAGEKVVHVLDVAAEDTYRSGEALRRALVDLGGARSVLTVALPKDDALLGAFIIYRREVRPFTDKQIALVQNFAAQAVIAMENVRLITELRQRTRDLQESLEYQTATSDVLKVVSRSTFDLQPVLDTLVNTAARLCSADLGHLTLRDGQVYRVAASFAFSDEWDAFIRQQTLTAGRDSVVGRSLLEARAVHIADITADPEYAVPEAITIGNIRTLLGVPLLRENEPIGVFAFGRSRVEPFTERQIALVSTFADQAVIAIENARLFNELRQRTHDLQQSLEYQTATSDVLKVISRSGAELGPMLDTLVETAARICRAESGFIFRLHDGLCRMVASFGIPAEYKDFQKRNPIEPGRGTLAGRTALERRAVHIEDAAADPEYTRIEGVQLGRQRTMLGVPLVREDALIGVITLARSRVERFTEKQIALVTTFADQAVIAIENARLLNDLRGRTHDLQESLEYQTATSDVLKVISQSTFDLEPVLQTVLDTAMRLCGNSQGEIFRLEDGVYRMAVGYGMEPGYRDIEAKLAITPGPHTLVGRTALAGRPVQIVDALADPDYEPKDDARIGKLRSMLGVPLLREGLPIGVICTARTTVEPFTEKQITLVSTFADQAVIAIENARLFNELHARTTELGRSVEELKMLSEVAQAVSSTLDLRAVLSTILTRSIGLTGADAGAIFRHSRAERAFHLVEAVGWDETLAHSVRDLRIAEAETAMSEAVARRAPIQLADLAERPSAPLRDASLASGFRGVLIVPLVGPERILGALVLQRRAIGEFPPETVQLMQTLASQSVLAIQNARLFREIADKSEQLALASQHKSQFLANMSHELRTPLNAILGYAELLVDGIYGALPDRPRGVLERIQNNGKHLLALINDVLDLAKIEAGQLTLTLEDYSLPEVVQSVVTATEPLATGKGLKFTVALQDGMPTAHGDARRASQVLLNLVGNAIKFTDEGEIEIGATADKGQFVLTVRDTGPGIADADQERIFGEFQQIDNSNTRNKGGTGLGLAISKRMVEMQGGMISVESAPGEGSTFRVVLPVYVDEVMEAAE